MPLALDHVFICCDDGAPEAEALRTIGLAEGSGNVHPGQGTSNRRFFFRQGYLELLWVHDPGEARSARTSPTRLWERWSGRSTGCCPFGLCFGAPVTESLPFPTWAYRPLYLPPDRAIHFASGLALDEPELFVLGWSTPPAPPPAQPIEHANGLLAINAVSIGLPLGSAPSAALQAAVAAGLVQIHPSAGFEMRLEFESRTPVRQRLPALGLEWVGQPRAA